MKPYYEADGIVIYHGDALDILPSLPLVDLVVTDPPYVIGAVSAGNIGSKAGGWGDMMNSARWFRDWYAMVHERLARDGAMWSFCNWRSLPVVMRAAIDANWSVGSLLVWEKGFLGPGGNTGLRPTYELVALLQREEHVISDRGTPDVWAQAWPAAVRKTGHPAEKPARLLQRLIDVSLEPALTRTGDTPLVLDPFMGSGSTLVAAKNCGLRAIGIEAEEKWCEVAVARLGQMVLDVERLSAENARRVA